MGTVKFDLGDLYVWTSDDSSVVLTVRKDGADDWFWEAYTPAGFTYEDSRETWVVPSSVTNGAAAMGAFATALAEWCEAFSNNYVTGREKFPKELVPVAAVLSELQRDLFPEDPPLKRYLAVMIIEHPDDQFLGGDLHTLLGVAGAELLTVQELP